MCQSTHMQQQQQQPTPSTSGGEDPSWREQGNAAFKDGQRGVPGAYLRAAALYTRAIKEEPTNAVLYR